MTAVLERPTAVTFHVPRKTLSDALALVVPQIAQRSSSPILKQINCRLGPDTLTLFVTNLDVDVETTLNVDYAGEPRSFALLPGGLTGVVAALDAELLELSLTDLELSLKGGSYHGTFSLNTGEVLAYETGEQPTATTDADTLLTLLSVSYACAVAEYQAVFRGVYFEPRGDMLRLIGTDGFRLAHNEAPYRGEFDGTAVVPQKSLEVLRKFLKGVGEVKLAAGRAALYVWAGAHRLSLKTLDGRFPDYERIIPSEFVTRFSVPKDELKKTLQLLTHTTDRTANNRINLAWNSAQGDAWVWSSETFTGRAELAHEVEVQQAEPKQTQHAFNLNYLLDALGPVTGDRLEVAFTGATSPCVLRDPDSSYLAMIVPLRTQ